MNTILWIHILIQNKFSNSVWKTLGFKNYANVILIGTQISPIWLENQTLIFLMELRWTPYACRRPFALCVLWILFVFKDLWMEDFFRFIGFESNQASVILKLVNTLHQFHANSFFFLFFILLILLWHFLNCCFPYTIPFTSIY